MFRASLILAFVLTATKVYAEDIFEPDDTAEQARVFTGSTLAMEHTLHDLNDIDWFKFTIPDDRVMRIIARTGVDRMRVKVFDASQELIVSGTAIIRDITAGTYFFSVQHPGNSAKGFVSDYNLYLTLSTYGPDGSEPNDISDDAVPLTEGVFKQLQSIAPAFDEDWFSFVAGGTKQPIGFNYIVETQAPLRPMRVEVFDRFGLPAQLTSSQVEARRAQVLLGPGLHRVRVTSWIDGDITPIYGIVARRTDRPDPYEVDDTPEDATLFMIDGPRQTHNFTNNTDEDWYLLFANVNESMLVDASSHVDLTLFAADAETILSGPSQGQISYNLPVGGGIFYVRATSRLASTTPENSVYSISAFLNNAGLNVVGTLTGVVTAGTKGAAINGVEVALTGQLQARTFTDSDGIFVFPMLTQGPYVVDASAVGYVGDERTIQVGGGVNTSNFTLSPIFVPDPEDIDGDGSINSIDIQFVINLVLGLTNLYDGDVNNDGSVNASDIQTVINRVLGL